ncbi:hypothetical protein [Pseudomonas japonica]|uniref:Uncharacterized protein n=1 Tax=Pseudomonas japonica TaxID=256466 RepID=A0A239BPC9_9PSED|nr:hypothetical protein [Pseudomonas japonica]SNS09736.1 hypothetical protein SAMN05444352_103113 [Pseudomonas japonica]
MSFFEDSIADGSHCAMCCEYIGEDVGYTRTCRTCGGGDSVDKKARKLENMARFETWLSNTGVQHSKHNDGYHVVLKLPGNKVIDCWPSTRKWQLRGQRISRDGKALHELVRKHLRPSP